MRLSHSDLRLLTASQTALLSPLDHTTREEWMHASMRAIKQVLRCDIATFVFASGIDIVGASEDFDPHLFEVFARFDEDDRDYEVLKNGLFAHHESVYVAGEALKRYTGRRMEETRIYQEFLTPAGVRDGPGLIVATAQGNATLALARSSQRAPGGAFERECQLLTLLLPAFVAGLRLIALIGRRAAELEGLLDGPDSGFVVVTASGRELHRSRRLLELLREERQPERLLAGIASVLPARGECADLTDPASVRVTTADATYDVTAAICSPGHIAPEATITVCVDRVNEVLPTPDRLRARWGLSVREAEVALLLARGASNKAIGATLGIRPGTVRTHTERVFLKMGIHTRKAIGLSILRA